MCRLAILCLLGLLNLLAAAAQAQQTDRPLLLVASPALQGAYNHTALIAAPLGERHFGFILNRATHVRLAALFPEHAPSAKQTPNEARYFAGFVAWQPGELARGWWYVAEPEAGLFFRPDTSGLWEELVRRMGHGHLPPRAPKLQSVDYLDDGGATLRLAAMRAPSAAR